MKLPTVLTALCVSRADGNYNAQGKLGAAVLGNVETRVYQLLLYKGKQQHVSSVRISPLFQFVVRTETERYNTSSECSSLFPQLGYLTDVTRILRFIRSEWITIIPCLYTVYLVNKLRCNYQMFAWLLSLCSHDIPWPLDIPDEADCPHASHMSACQVELSHGTATDLDKITKQTWVMHVNCVMFSVRPWLQSDIQFWIPSFWTLRISGN
jgi:hypothetical protein